MNDTVVEELEKIIIQFGKAIINDPRRLEALLNDKCAGYKREINILLIALKENVPSNLAKMNHSEELEFWIPHLTKRVIENWHLQEETARWSVETWAKALGFKDYFTTPKPGAVSKPPPTPTIAVPKSQTQAKNRQFLLWAFLGVLIVMILIVIQGDQSDSLNSSQNTLETKAILAINTSPTAAQTLVAQLITPIVASVLTTSTPPAIVGESKNTAKPAEPKSSATNIPQPAQISPDKFILEYFSDINSRKYNKTWTMLSSYFKETYNSLGYGPYVDWWDTIKEVKILSTEVNYQNSTEAIVSVELSYYLKDGRVDTYDLVEFGLIYDSSTKKWQFDTQKLIKTHR